MTRAVPDDQPEQALSDRAADAGAERGWLVVFAYRQVRALAIPVSIFVLAFLTRLLPVLRGGGLHFYNRYDDAVYYTAAESLSFGHLPYRDYVLLQPPGSTLSLQPFVWLGRLTSDPTAMATARLAFMSLGGLNAVLIYLIAARWGLVHGIVAGLIYAASAIAGNTEQTTYLEPMGTTLTLVAVLGLYRASGPRNTAASSPAVMLEIIAGVALGLSCTIKIWYAATSVGLVLVILLQRRFRAALRVAGAGVVSAAVVLLPFFVAAPNRMWTMVVKDQIGRGAVPNRLNRVPNVLGAETMLGAHTPTLRHAVTIVVVVLILVAAALCWTERYAWPLAGLFVVSAVVLLASPAYFPHYGLLVVAPIALVVPVGLGKVVNRVPGRTARAVLVTLAAVFVVLSSVRVATVPVGRAFPRARLAAAAPAGCIASDNPDVLIQLDRLTANFRAGCDVPVDVTGASYASPLPRRKNTAFHAWLMKHLLDSAAYTVQRPQWDELTTAELRVLYAQPVLARAQGLTLYQGNGRSIKATVGQRSRTGIESHAYGALTAAGRLLSVVDLPDDAVIPDADEAGVRWPR